MPDWSNSSPVVVSDRLFVCAEPTTLVAVDTKDGKILWQKTNTYLDVLSEEEAAKAREDEAKAQQLAKEKQRIEAEIQKLQKELQAGPNVLDDPDQAEEKRKGIEDKVKGLKEQVSKLQAQAETFSKYKLPATHPVNGYSSPTPVTDGKVVCVVFGTGVASSYDLEGNRKWAKMLLKPPQEWGHSASPLLVGDRFLAHIGDHLIALNKENGEELWRTPARVGWGSAIGTRVGHEDVVVTPDGDILRVRDGRKIAAGIGSLTYNAPVANSGIVYFVDGERTSLALRLPQEAADSIRPEVLWSVKDTIAKERYYASPVALGGVIYGIMQRNVLSALDAATGERVYDRNMDLGGGTVFPSITAAGNYLFVSSDSGTTIVLEAGREYKEVAANHLEAFRSCPVFVGDRIYIRAHKTLYCIGSL
jgi:outer membrane protein assembly factor BamB